MAARGFFIRYNQARIGMGILTIAVVLAATSGMRPVLWWTLAGLTVLVAWGLIARGVLCPHCNRPAMRLRDLPLVAGPPDQCVRCGGSLDGSSTARDPEDEPVL
jgi:hypothetical protein